ncbi:MAG: hypothetical protein QM820_37605 [Minicystis sp.]
MPEVHQAPSGGKGGDPPAALVFLRRLVQAARELRDQWGPEVDGSIYPRTRHDFDGLVQLLERWLDDVEARPMAPAGGSYALDLDDRALVRAWLFTLRTKVEDAVAAGEDATRPLGRRELGRQTARSAILEAGHAIDGMLAAAERGAKKAAR